MRRWLLAAGGILAVTALTLLIFVGAFWLIFVLPFAGFVGLTVLFSVMAVGQPAPGPRRGFVAALPARGPEDVPPR